MPTPAPTPEPPPPEVKTSVAGKVIDGYISGATVWLDINANHVKDADEPFAVSKAAGAYQLELNESQKACLPYATLYVDVPVGAVDEDTGPVKAAYQMAMAPQLRPLTPEQVMNISPLTTAIWDQVRTRLTATSANLNSCEQLRQNQQLRESMSSEIRNVMGDLVSRYNLSEARIHADFIQTQDTGSHALAQDIVKGLKAGYAYKQQLHAQYPDARFIRAEVYRGRGTDNINDRAGVWYRNVSVWRPSGYRHEWVMLDDSLTRVTRVLNLTVEDSQPFGNASLKTTRSAYNVDDMNSDYGCFTHESVAQVRDGVTYELVVQYADPKREADPLACLGDAHATPGTPTLLDYYAHYTKGLVSYTNVLRFSPQQPEFGALSAWHHLQGKGGQLDFSPVIARIAASGIRFDEDVLLATDSWYKRSTDDTDLRITVEKANAGPWVRITTRTDKTTYKECSTDSGKTWVSCTR
ncbi:hypothetical protein [Roseateles sp. BYS87W]|uniref:Carboxypeptidase regulatory-like domain-containing protein n=1 Tax=Pelomonas baiyunensis TaxID=3299026 RepID=A0ABW7GW98_9BURK